MAGHTPVGHGLWREWHGVARSTIAPGFSVRRYTAKQNSGLGVEPPGAEHCAPTGSGDDG